MIDSIVRTQIIRGYLGALKLLDSHSTADVWIVIRHIGQKTCVDVGKHPHRRASTLSPGREPYRKCPRSERWSHRDRPAPGLEPYICDIWKSARSRFDLESQSYPMIKCSTARMNGGSDQVSPARHGEYVSIPLLS